MLKELKTGDWTINDLRGIFSFLKEHGGRTFGTYNIDPLIATRYANRSINPKYYGKISDKGFFDEDGTWKPLLTLEEFKAGKPGYILANFRTELSTLVI